MMLRTAILSAGLSLISFGALAEAITPPPDSELMDPTLSFPPSGTRHTQANLTLALTQTDGTVNVAIARDPGREKLIELLQLMVLTTADQVRISTVYDPDTLSVTADQTAVLDVVRGFISEHGVNWQVCDGWWGTPGREHLSRRVIEDFGGSVVLIDNGPSSDAFDNPSADFMQARLDDPAYADVFGETRRLTDGEQYLNAVEGFWSQVMLDKGMDPERKDARGGWINGC